jgi:acetolactate synthase-1/2/3 large subunit
MGKGVVAEDHPYGLGHAWNPWGEDNPLDELLQRCDVVLAIGSKLGAQETNFWKMPLPKTMIRVEIDPAEVSLNYGDPTVGIVADAGATVDGLLDLLRERGGIQPRTAPAEVAEYRRRYLTSDEDARFDPYIEALRGALPREGIIVQDMTMMSYRMNDRFPALAPRTYLFPSSYGTLGFSVPAAIGTKIGNPGRPVMAIVGDGGFQFTMQEVATAVQHDVSLPIVIFNDSTYTAVEMAMKWEYDGRVMATDLKNPDYVKLAAAYGIPGVRAANAGQLADAVTTAFARRGPTIIDVPIPKL